MNLLVVHAGKGKSNLMSLYLLSQRVLFGIPKGLKTGQYGKRNSENYLLNEQTGEGCKC